MEQARKCGEVNNKLGFIIRKDEFYEDYYIELIFGNKDWFNENSIERILGEKRNKTDKYQVRLCTTKQGYEQLKSNIKSCEPISNNKFKKIDIYRKFYIDNKDYIIIGWKSVYWPVSNKSIMILESTLKKFKSINIPFQYVLINENVLSDIKTMEFSENDDNVKVFSVERKIKVNFKNTADYLQQRKDKE